MIWSLLHININEINTDYILIDSFICICIIAKVIDKFAVCVIQKIQILKINITINKIFVLEGC
jgi:hypothetical protein